MAFSTQETNNIDYFELYHTHRNLLIKRPLLQARFYELCKVYHPDKQTLPSHEGRLSIEEINLGYEILKNSGKRLAYLLQLEGLLGQDSKQSLPPHFLMEMLEVGEKVEELRQSKGSEADFFASLDSVLNPYYQAVSEPIADLLAPDFPDRHLTPSELSSLKEYYVQKKYLDRIYEPYLRV